jgi:D-sedoheptulose 7-phosphate isomerase
MITVFTNGCFDLLHPGHIDLLEQARALGDRLIVGLNSDRSVRALKGPSRPFMPEAERAAMLRALRCVDEVIVFDELTPARLIDQLQPDVLVKGGDWPIEQIVGADTVRRRGGRVLSLPLKPGYSTTALAERIQAATASYGRIKTDTDVQHTLQLQTPLMRSLLEHQETIAGLIRRSAPQIQRGAELIIAALRAGKKLLICGNGGSAADAQHIAAEFVGRFERERRAYPAIALTTDSSAVTAIANDYGFEQLFARQVEGLAMPGDVVIGISTSGNSPNVLAAIMAARQRGCRTIALTGALGKRLAALCDVAILVPSARTSRIQEAHITIGHLWCELADLSLDDPAEARLGRDIAEVDTLPELARLSAG